MNNKRVWIAGGTGTGKSTFADSLGRKLNIPVIHGDFLITTEKDNWSKMPHLLIEQIKNKDSYIIEMTQVGRMCRKIEELGLDLRPTEYYYLTEHMGTIQLTPKQVSFNKSVNTIQLECNKILENWGVEITYELPEVFEQKDLDSLGWGG